ncbi:MAG: AMP-binding protein [Magnetospirillum sp.]|nr:AMP-binding protein [Magnetospirillum sp.]
MNLVHVGSAGEVGMDLAGRAAGVAALLGRMGVVPGRPVAVRTGSALALALLARAAPAVGVALFPIDPDLPEAAVGDLLDTAAIRHVVAERPLAGRTTIPVADVLAARALPPVSPRLAGADIALLIATSGSTGQPKAAMLTEDNLRAAAAASARVLPLGPGDRWLACLPLFHIGGYSILSRCVRAGAGIVLHERFDPQAVAATLSRHAVSHVSLVPAMLARLLDGVGDAPPPPALRHVLIGGAALSQALAERASAAGWPIRPSYGMTETASQLATLAELRPGWRRGMVGPPLPGAQVAFDGAGRLMVRGPMVMAGYANPALRPGEGLSDGWFVTNDLGEFTEAGELIVHGRADDMLVSGGKTISPHMVEDMLARCPDIGAVAVTGRGDPAWGDVLVAIFTGAVAADALLAWCRESIPAPWRPRRALKIPALPLTASGKLDRKALRRLAEGDEADSGSGGEPQPAG